jgi:hypothetical protein
MMRFIFKLGKKSSRLWDEDGQALIESFLSSAILILLMTGAVEFGRVAYATIEVSNAARAATQYGAMNGGAFLNTDSTGMDSVGMLNAAQGDAGNLGSTVSFTSGYPTYTCFCSSSTDTTASCVPPATPSGCTASHLIVTVKVQTQATYDPLIYVPGLNKTIVVHGSSQEQVLQ